MRLVMLWAGIAAFVWIGLHPPIPGGRHSAGSRPLRG
jgi:hypothetical protein